jgi:hypothetical protein
MLAAVATYAVEKPLQQWLTNALTVPVSKKHDDLRDEEELQVSEHAKCCCCTVKSTGTSNEFDEESSDFVHTGSCGQATGCFCCCGRSDPSHGKKCCGGCDYCCAVDAFEVERDTCCCDDCCGGWCKKFGFIFEKCCALSMPCCIPVHENCCWNFCQCGYWCCCSSAWCGNFCTVSTYYKDNKHGDFIFRKRAHTFSAVFACKRTASRCAASWGNQAC